MESRVIIVGKSKREWMDKNTGEVRNYKEIHVVHCKPPKDDGFEGQKVEIIRLPDKVSYESIRIGSTYDLEFEARNTRNGVFLVLVGMEYVDLADDYEAARSA